MQNNVTIVCPIVYGSIAFYLGKKAQEFQTHRWTLYVRGPQDEDLSTFVSKVVFTLHPSFAQPVREVTNPPFQISETGWGEFEAGIRIFFVDEKEQPVDIFHQLRLYPPSQQLLNIKKPVVAESYDEIVFRSPSPAFHERLLQFGTAVTSTKRALRPPTAWPEYYLTFDDSMDMEVLLSIQQHLRQEVLNAKRKLISIDAQLVERGLLAAAQAITEQNVNILAETAVTSNGGGGGGEENEFKAQQQSSSSFSSSSTAVNFLGEKIATDTMDVS